MRINTNMAALNAWRSMETNQTNLQKSLARLSSGYRINTAADDAAGLAVSEKMRAQIRGINMAARNAQDGVSLVQTAEGGAGKIQDMLQRMRELAVQASSGSLQDSDRAQLSTEFEQLKDEISRETNSTTFNGISLLKNGAFTSTSSGAGLASVNVDDFTGVAGDYSVNITAAGSAAKNTSTNAVSGSKTATDNNTTANSGYGVKIVAGGTTINVSVAKAGDTITGAAIASAINTAVAGSAAAGKIQATYDSTADKVTITNKFEDATGVNTSVVVSDYYQDGTTTANTNNVIFGSGGGALTVAAGDVGVDTTGNSVAAVGTQTAYNSDTAANSGYSLKLSVDGSASVVGFQAAAGQTFTLQDIVNSINSKNLGITASINTSSKLVLTSNSIGVGHSISYGENYADGSTTYGAALFGANNATAGTDIAGTINGTAITNTQWTGSGVLTLGTGVSAKVTGTGSSLTTVTSNALKIQVGANSGETINVTLASTTNAKLGIESLSIASVAAMKLSATDNTNVLNALDSAVNYVSKTRSTMGAVQNRLESAIGNLQTMSENLTAAESRIRDIDMAAEMATFTRFQVLSQASTAMLAQANQLPQGILSLLR